MNQYTLGSWCSITLVGLICATSQLSAVTLLLDSETPGDGVESINVTGEHHDEVSLPIYESFIQGTEQGYAWGGFKVNGENVIFTNTRVYDYAGNSTIRAAQLIGDENGMGIDSKAQYEGERPWMIDGKEGYAWTANQDLQFLGLQFRVGWDGGSSHGSKELSISSPAWINLKDVEPRYGITYIAATGTFQVSNKMGSVSMDHKVTVEELVGLNGPRLNVPSGVEIAFVHTGDVTEAGGFALKTVAFDSAGSGSDAYRSVPELQVFGLMLSLFAFCLVGSRRRIR